MSELLKAYNVDAIIFDWDGVFVLGADEGYLQCYAAAASGLGIQMDRETIMARMDAATGQPHQEDMIMLTRDMAVPEQQARAIKLYEDNLFGNTFVNELRVVEGSVSLLLRLRQEGRRLTLATGAHPEVLTTRVMPNFGIDPEWFDQIVTSYDVPPGRAKPHPFSLLHILDTLGIAHDNAVMVGDARNDVLMAQSACIEPIVVLTGQLDREQAEVLGVKHVIPDVTHLEDVLAEL